MLLRKALNNGCFLFDAERGKTHKQKQNWWHFSGFHLQLETGGPRQLVSVLEYNWSRSRTPGPGSVSSCLQTASGKGGKKPQWCVVHRRVGPPSSPRQLSDRSSFFFIAGLPLTLPHKVGVFSPHCQMSNKGVNN